MAFDWLYGPPSELNGGNSMFFRSLTLDCDTVREVAAMIADFTGGVYTRSNPHNPIDIQPFDGTDLEQAPAHKIETLQLIGEGQQFLLRLSSDSRGVVDWSQPEHAQLATKVVDHLLAEGRPRPEFGSLYLIGHLVPATLIASWLWFLATNDPDLSFTIAGTLVVAICAVVARKVPKEIKARFRIRENAGMRILPQSRAETRRRRADRNAGLKEAAITIPLGAVIGAILTLILK